MRRTTIALLSLTALALTVVPRAFADDDRDDDDGGPAPGPSAVRRATHDVRVRIGNARATPGGMRVRVRVVNRGRSPEPGVTVSVFSDAAPGTPLWTATTDLRRRGRRTWRLVLEVPDGTTSLTATAECSSAADEWPADNSDTTPTDPSSGAGGNAAGAALFTSLCSSCHGATGTGAGGTVDEDISRKGGGDILEAVREGEDGMPTFPGITWQDAQAIAAYLADPVAPPPPGTGGTGTGGGTGGTTPTYTGQIAALLSANCTACHSGTAAPMKIRLDTYSAASANASKALASMSAGRMPPAGPLPAGTIATFQAWVNGGKPR